MTREHFQRVPKHESRPLTLRDAKFEVWENTVALVIPKEVEADMWLVPDQPLREFGRECWLSCVIQYCMYGLQDPC